MMPDKVFIDTWGWLAIGHRKDLAIESGYITVDRITSQRFLSAWESRKKFKDKPLISFTDIATMVIMRERGIKYILTKDEHFTHVGMDLQTVF
jgi:predicted nucleic acid-binding protein